MLCIYKPTEAEPNALPSIDFKEYNLAFRWSHGPEATSCKQWLQATFPWGTFMKCYLFSASERNRDKDMDRQRERQRQREGTWEWGKWECDFQPSGKGTCWKDWVRLWGKADETVCIVRMSACPDHPGSEKGTATHKQNSVVDSRWCDNTKIGQGKSSALHVVRKEPLRFQSHGTCI